MSRLSVPRRAVVLALTASAGAGIAVGALSACSSGAAQAPGTVPAAATGPAWAPTTSPTSSPSAVPVPAPSGPVTADQASAIALQASPGTVTEVEQDVQPAGPVFDVKVQHPDGTETKVEVAGGTGQVLSTETEGQDDQNEQPGDTQ